MADTIEIEITEVQDIVNVGGGEGGEPGEGTVITVTAGIARFTIGPTTYYFPVSTTSP
jgi:hypothetical protein